MLATLSAHRKQLLATPFSVVDGCIEVFAPSSNTGARTTRYAKLPVVQSAIPNDLWQSLNREFETPVGSVPRLLWLVEKVLLTDTLLLG